MLLQRHSGHDTDGRERALEFTIYEGNTIGMGHSPRDLKDGWTPEHLPCLLHPQAPHSLGRLPGSDADFGKDIMSSSPLSSGPL
ncbi:hypothetical protein CapIbe_017982 [Capra ibex]